jgi:hypothetical protein
MELSLKERLKISNLMARENSSIARAMSWMDSSKMGNSKDKDPTNTKV